MGQTESKKSLCVCVGGGAEQEWITIKTNGGRERKIKGNEKGKKKNIWIKNNELNGSSITTCSFCYQLAVKKNQ